MPCSSHQNAPQKGLISISRMRGEKELQRAKNIQMATFPSSPQIFPNLSTLTQACTHTIPKMLPEPGKAWEEAGDQRDSPRRQATTLTRRNNSTQKQKGCEDTHQRALKSTIPHNKHVQQRKNSSSASERHVPRKADVLKTQIEKHEDNTQKIREPSISCKPAAANRLQRTKRLSRNRRANKAATAPIS